MTHSHLRAAVAMLAAFALIAPASARARGPVADASVHAVTLRHLDLHPKSRRAAQVTLARLSDAALEACGASSFSLREVQADAKASMCWRDGMADVVDRIGDPVLAAAFAGRHGRTSLQQSAGAGS
ncbi:UrcA family protein [Sphingomonas nostoxanthinifaciens]|uniref:UrcA family protein n=1 Tax=Sphingomonas nostoxanthinifaciens TaxID=2872652 RepID=UPI001CC1D3FD|nr:UrcA family protein [Sphingomonas nostoxanthinifaciens]UAK26245.1 UrcA family protein [Sphingomonas nostoxanthinifaciens]